MTIAKPLSYACAFTFEFLLSFGLVCSWALALPPFRSVRSFNSEFVGLEPFPAVVLGGL